MRDGSIAIALIVETLVTEIERFAELNFDFQVYKKSYLSIKNKFPSLTEEEISNIIQMAISLYNYKTQENVELVITAPNSFKLKALKTSNVVHDLINKAQKSITLTGYSISDYFSELLDELLDKSRKGVYVNLYINDVTSKQELLNKLIVYMGKFLNIYDYKIGPDKIAALHAKIIVVDGQRTLISSSNLSYHGLKGNIEMGVLINSSKKACNVEELLKQLKAQKLFTEL